MGLPPSDVEQRGLEAGGYAGRPTLGGPASARTDRASLTGAVPCSPWDTEGPGRPEEAADGSSPLGRTGVSVSKLCLGAMMFGDWGNRDHDESIRIIHRALNAGINFIDTADVYSQGESEVIVGKALAGGRRDDVVLATKV
jgi:hypothetical protein